FSDSEIALKSNEVSEMLIKGPESIGIFKKQVEDRLFVAEASNNTEEVARINEFLKFVNILLKKHRWDKETNVSLTPLQASVILENLPGLKKTKNIAIYERLIASISENIAAGFISKRFSGTNEWRK